MGILLIVLAVFLVFLNGEIFPRQSNSHRERFLGEYTPAYNPNGSNDYYYDRTGLKGTMFVSGEKKYELPEEVEPQNSYGKTVKKLELYPETFYSECVSDFDYEEMANTHLVVNNDQLNTYQSINKGVLVRNRCGSVSACSDKS